MTHGKAISTPEELYLLTHIFLSTQYAEEAVKTLQGDALGLSSQVGGQDPQLTLSLLLDSLKQTGQRQEVFTICHKLLTEEGSQGDDHRNDDRIWDLLIGALSTSEDARYVLNCWCYSPTDL